MINQSRVSSFNQGSYKRKSKKGKVHLVKKKKREGMSQGTKRLVRTGLLLTPLALTGIAVMIARKKAARIDMDNQRHFEKMIKDREKLRDNWTKLKDTLNNPGASSARSVNNNAPRNITNDPGVTIN